MTGVPFERRREREERGCQAAGRHDLDLVGSRRGGPQHRRDPQFPLTIKTTDGGAETVDTLEDLAMALEWFDSSNSDGSISVVDAKGRDVSVKIEAMQVERLQVTDSD